MSTIHTHIHNNSLLKSSTVFTQSMNIREEQEQEHFSPLTTTNILGLFTNIINNKTVDCWANACTSQVTVLILHSTHTADGGIQSQWPMSLDGKNHMASVSSKRIAWFHVCDNKIIMARLPAVNNLHLAIRPICSTTAGKVNKKSKEVDVLEVTQKLTSLQGQVSGSVIKSS